MQVHRVGNLTPCGRWGRAAPNLAGMTTRADWERAAAGVLRKSGRLTDDDPDDAVWSALTRTTYDGIAVPPLGVPGEHGSVRPERVGPWDIRTFCAAGLEELVNGEVLADLEGGATSVWLAADPDTDFAVLLADIRLDLAGVVLHDPNDAPATARGFLEHAGGTALHPSTNLGIPAAAADADLAALAGQAGVVGFVADGLPVHADGASDSQELGWVFAEVAAYLRALESAGVPVADAARLVELRLAVTDVQFLAIAKLRAARRLWARLLEVCEAEQVPLRIHAVTSAPMTSELDPWVNMLRGTVAGFAAGVGGADAVTVRPFDEPLGRPDAFGRRIARNVSSLLIAESHVAAVADPAGGAYAVEQLTDDLAAAAWAELGRIDAEGATAFEARVREVRERRLDDVARRRLPMTGLSEYPLLDETRPVRPPGGSAGPSYGEAFATLRRDPASGHVFLATLGSVAQHAARAGSATNLLAAGGIAVDPARGTSGVEDLLAAYAGQPVVCLAGTDSAYAEWGSEAATALHQAGARHVVLVGGPAKDWVDDAFAEGDDAVAFLTRCRSAIEEAGR